MKKAVHSKKRIRKRVYLGKDGQGKLIYRLVEIIKGKSVQKDGEAKTEASIRIIDIPQQLVDVLTRKQGDITLL